ncbi:hypothetical protein Tco_0432050 [Tanacetum coccineum]
MLADELHNISDGTLNDVQTALNDIVKGIRMEYLPKRKWSGLDKGRARNQRDLPRDIPLDSVEVLRSWCSIEHQGSFLKGLDYRGFATRCRNIQGSWIFELSMLSTLGKESSKFVGFSVIKDRQRSPVSFWVLDGISSKNKEPGYQNKQRVWTKMTETKFDTEKFDGKNDFALWQVRMKALLEQQGLASSLKELHAATIATYNNFLQKKAYSALILCFETLLYGWDTLKLEDMLVTLNSRELQKMTEAKGDGGKGLYNHKKSQGFQKMTEAKGDGGRKQQTQVSDSGADGECRIRGTSKVQVQMRDGSSFVLNNVRYVPELRRNLISLGTLEKEGFTVKMQSGKIKASLRKSHGKPMDKAHMADLYCKFINLSMQWKRVLGSQKLLEADFGQQIVVKTHYTERSWVKQSCVNTVGIKRLLDDLKVTAAKVCVTAAK